MKALLIAAANRTTGGAERHVADLLRGLPESDVDPVLLCPAGGDLTERAHDLGVEVHHVEIAQGISASRIVGVRKAIAAVDPDIVHAHGSRAAMFARFADTEARSHLVYTVHGIHMDKAGSRPRQIAFLSLERHLRDRTARFVTVCASDVEKGAALRIIDRAHTSVVHNGIDLPSPEERGAFRAELALGADVPLALSIGRFHQQKDQRMLLTAWAIVLQTLPHAVLALVGSGEIESELRECAAALGLGQNVRFVTPRPDLAPVYTDADVFVLSSLWEGLPYVVLEAMGYAVPVVSTDVDGIPEAVEHGVSGLLSASGDADALAQGVLTVLSDPKGARGMGEAGRDTIQTRFDIATMVDKTVGIYREVVG